MDYTDRNTLHQLFVVDNLTVGEIAKRLGANIHTIGRWIKKYGLTKRHADVSWLTEQYITNGLSTTQIAELAGVHHSVIQRALKRFNIQARTISSANTLKWQDPLYKYKLLSTLRGDTHRKKLSNIWNDEYRAHQSRAQSDRWKSEEYRTLQSEAHKRQWNSPEYREKMAKIMSSEHWRLNNAMARANMPRVSSIQRTLYSILDDLGITYFREYEDKPADIECTIGPWTFDCVIPRAGKSTLLIECQGEYFHNIPIERARDKAKASYISTLPQYELKCIWEHEFKNHNKVVELLKYWLGITAMEVVDFEFDDVDIRRCNADDYRLLLSKYHYLANGGRGGMAYGAYLGDELIAVCVFTPLPRQNITIGLYKSGEIRDLSRLCIHPRYQKKNFASWFVSKCLRLLDRKYKCVITYCDTTFNHDGAIYKACNFALDGTVPPDYWYVTDDGWKMHKKTLYSRAVKMGMTEHEYAAINGYSKVHGGEKLRFRYNK